MKKRILLLASLIALGGCSDGDGNDKDYLGGEYPDLRAPTIYSVEDVEIEANVSTELVALRIADGITEASALVVGLSSSNMDLLPDSSIVVSRNGDMFSIVLTPVAEMTGTTTITISAEDLAGNTASRSFDAVVVNRMISDVDLVSEITALDADAAPVAINAVDVSNSAEAGASFDAIVEMN